MYFRSQLVELLCDGVRDGAAHAAAYNRHFFEPFYVGRYPQGSDKIVKAVALIQMV